MVSPVSVGVVCVGVVCVGKSMRQLEEAVLEVLVEAVGGGERPGVAEISRWAEMTAGKAIPAGASPAAWGTRPPGGSS